MCPAIFFEASSGALNGLFRSGEYGTFEDTLREMSEQPRFEAALVSSFAAIVLRRALVLGLSGISIGAFASLLATRLVSDLLFRVRPLDPSTFTVVTLTLLLVSIASALVPAVRAARVDPMRHLRDE